MFEPAGVRTLLHLRCSDPVRPSTAGYPAAEPPSCSEPRPGDAAGDAAASADEVSGGHRSGLDGTLEDEAEELAEDQDDAERDPSELLARASAELFQLQTAWAEERRREVDTLRLSLEGQYGFSLSADECASMQRRRGGAESGVSSPALSPSAASSPSRAAEAGEAQINEVLGVAARELEAVRELRARLLARRHQREQGAAAGETGREQDWTLATQAALAKADDEDAERLAALRREVSRLQVGPCWEEEQEPHEDLADADAAETGSRLEALDRWVSGLRSDLQMLGAAISPGPSPSASPAHSRGSRGSPLSRKAMAGMAEARAVERAAHGSASPCRSPGATRAEASLPRGLPTSPDRGGAAGMAPAGPEMLDMDLQLDEILGELDEIDRIHGGLRLLSKS